MNPIWLFVILQPDRNIICSFNEKCMNCFVHWIIFKLFYIIYIYLFEIDYQFILNIFYL